MPQFLVIEHVDPLKVLKSARSCQYLQSNNQDLHFSLFTQQLSDIMFAFVQLFSVVFSSIYIAGAQAQVANCARNYTVAPGDFCDGISAAQHASTYQLASLNPQVDALCDNLFVGEVLCLGLVGKDCQNTHIVQSGEGCNAITAGAGITFGILRTNNPNVDANCTNIYPGEVLCVAAQSFAK
ncbi:hypothetical protein BD779DRAFT_1677899 [Infundibulicybe gibba]|nr:hypothetical protein BD779DRAFT_1677899 [Infundibulicybe gibba]